MDRLKLSAARRKVLGKKTRFLRRQAITPVHLFGHDIESLALQCDTAQVRHIIAQAGETRLIDLTVEGEKQPKSVFIREVQRDVFGRQLLHVDFYQVKKGERITVDVPLVLVGEAPALKGKGRLLTRATTSLSVECLPEDVPPKIEVDISQLTDLEQAILVKDIALGPGVTVLVDAEQLVVKVSEVIVKEVVEEAAPAAEAPAEEAKPAPPPGEEAK